MTKKLSIRCVIILCITLKIKHKNCFIEPKIDVIRNKSTIPKKSIMFNHREFAA